jgi:hypothetical protein
MEPSRLAPVSSWLKDWHLRPGSDCFGWALEEAISESRELLLHPRRDDCAHHHKRRDTFFQSDPVTREKQQDLGTSSDNNNNNSSSSSSSNNYNTKTPQRRFTWWPTWNELTRHYLRDIGFLACLSQMIGATVFWVCGFTGLPPIYNALSVPVANGVFWLPQVVGGTGFIVSSTLFMVEVQDKWWKPAPQSKWE